MMFAPIISMLTQLETVSLFSGFTIALVLLIASEQLFPQRRHNYTKRAFWNSVILLFNTLLKLLVPFSLVAASLFAIYEQFGLLNMVKLGLWTKIVIAWLILDLFSYTLHRLYHNVSWLWRFHRVHHSDASIDVTTPFRTHPVELFVTLCAKAGVVVLFGMPLLGVIIYEIIMAVMAVWAHANIRVSPNVESRLEWLIVTPGYHLKHHGSTVETSKCNFGLVLTVWDQIFGTVSKPSKETDQPAGYALAGSGDESFIKLLAMPFRAAE